MENEEQDYPNIMEFLLKPPHYTNSYFFELIRDFCFAKYHFLIYGNAGEDNMEGYRWVYRKKYT